MIRDLVIVGAGSAVGGMFRFLAGRMVSRLVQDPFPWATLLVNISGSLLIGYLYASYLRGEQVSPSWLLFLATGCCGGFTTFSAFSYENLLLIRNGQVVMAIIYILVSVLLSLLAVWAGYNLGK